ncbi:MAG: hypothetical protein Phog2KO_50220 [Phototrophicaceae bacterium]
MFTQNFFKDETLGGVPTPLLKVKISPLDGDASRVKVDGEGCWVVDSGCY